jgi:hypothetical protein
MQPWCRKLTDAARGCELERAWGGSLGDGVLELPHSRRAGDDELKVPHGSQAGEDGLELPHAWQAGRRAGHNELQRQRPAGPTCQVLFFFSVFLVFLCFVLTAMNLLERRDYPGSGAKE